MKTVAGKKITDGTRFEILNGDKYVHLYTSSADMISEYTKFLDENPDCGNYTYDEDMLVVNILRECIPMFDPKLDGEEQ